jgi:prephenate dehydrogenase
MRSQSAGDFMKQWETVAIVGVGLIGGSVGLALRQRGLAKRIIGIGRRPANLKAAKRVGAVTRTSLDLSRGVAEAELVVVCTPVAQVAAHVKQAAQSANGALITDAASSKRQIVAALNGSLPSGTRFVGSHPLAGSEQSGALSARADLFAGRLVVITPTRRTRTADIEAVSCFWESLGAGVVQMTPAAHDHALASTSHAPHAVAYALAASVPKAHLSLAASGLRDTTRIAASDPELWAQILLSNRSDVLLSLDRFENCLAEVREAIRQGDEARLIKLLAQAKRKRDALGS